ncbi:MAG TPA: hypothetical protein V6D25_21305 [Leptolyngbyaceae cyanobacterium]
MDISQLKWLKNVKTDDGWAYSDPHEMPIPEAKIFRLHWRNVEGKSNAQKPHKGELMLLIQKAKVTHIVEFVDDKVYEIEDKEWNVYRIVRTVWMPLNNFDWEKLPHQREFFGYDYVVFDGLAHSLSDSHSMWQFHEHWDKQGGLTAFQKHLGDMLTNIS